MRLVRRLQGRPDHGESLIEILVTVVVLGITVTALVAGLTLAFASSGKHRRLSDVEVVSRAYTEQIVQQASQQPATTLTANAAAGDTSISVAAVPGVTFPSAPYTSVPFTASVDGEVVDVTSVSGTTWRVSALAEDHSNGAPVQQYLFYNAHADRCPAASLFAPANFTAPATTNANGRINPPTITSIEYFGDGSATPISAAACDTYWSDTGEPCSTFDPADTSHETQCDVDLIRLTVAVASADSATQSGARTTTAVLIRRGNA